MTGLRTHITILFTGLMMIISTGAFAQGEVGFGTDTPGEKADINGALIIRGDAAAVTPVAGTIRWNATDGKHDGRVSAGTWVRLQNDNTYEEDGDYTSLECGITLTTAAGIVTGASTTAVETPFATQYQDKRGQYLYYGSDIVGGGLCAGYITEIGFQVSTLGSPATLNSMQVKLKMTTTTSLTGTIWETGLTTYFGPGAITLAPGPNYVSLTSGAYPSGFYWDGYSNVLVEICFDNASNSFNSAVDVQSGLAYQATRTAYANFVAGCGLAATTTDSKRPVIFFTGNANGPVTGTGDYLQFDDPIVVGDPVLPAPYLHHGPGTITAEAIYDENIIISDYVFDHYFDGVISDADKQLHADYTMYTLEEMEQHMREKRHLPTIKGRDAWENKRFSTGELATQLWVTLETHALYIKEIHERTTAVEQIMTTPDALLLEAYQMEIDRIQADAQMSAAEKSVKTELLNQSILEIRNGH